MAITLKLEERLNDASNKANKLRREGYVPGVIYGKGIGSRSIKVKASDLRTLLSAHGKTSLITATFENGESVPALIKEIQYGILKDEYLSIDLHQVSMNEKVRSEVPIRVIGRESVERAGGVVAQQINSVEIECLPQDTPQYIEADISNLIPGQALTAGDLKLPESVTLLTEPEQIVLSIIVAKSETAESETPEEENTPEE
ncbi:MAG TPA: 50S ribosomal protein L25 [Clostridiaceae bacterium]|nr:50S ribosomal protein L25 [Clostridiaceae bacterium]